MGCRYDITERKMVVFCAVCRDNAATHELRLWQENGSVLTHRMCEKCAAEMEGFWQENGHVRRGGAVA